MSTIAISDVSAMLCELGIELAQHFDLDADEVSEYLDTLCQEKLGVETGVKGLLEEAKEQDDDAITFSPDGFSSVGINAIPPEKDLKKLRQKGSWTVRKNNKEGTVYVKCKEETLKAMNGLIKTLEEMGYENTAVMGDDGSWMGKEFVDILKKSHTKDKVAKMTHQDILSVKKNNDLGCWVLVLNKGTDVEEVTNLVVKSAKAKKTLVGYITKKGELSEKIPKSIRNKANELGLE